MAKANSYHNCVIFADIYGKSFSNVDWGVDKKLNTLVDEYSIISILPMVPNN